MKRVAVAFSLVLMLIFSCAFSGCTKKIDNWKFELPADQVVAIYIVDYDDKEKVLKELDPSLAEELYRDIESLPRRMSNPPGGNFIHRGFLIKYVGTCYIKMSYGFQGVYNVGEPTEYYSGAFDWEQFNFLVQVYLHLK